MRSGTEKRCSYNQQIGHPSYWSADNCSIFPRVNIFKIEARSELAGEMVKKLKKKYVMHLCCCCCCFFSYRICLLVLNLQGKLKRKTNNNPLDRFKSYIVFAGRGHQKIIEVMMVMKITGQSVKFIGSAYMVCSFSKPLICGFGRNAHDRVNPN